MLAQTTYIEYLLSMPTNYSCTHLAAHLPDVSHDQVNRFLRTSTLPTNQLRELVQPLLRDSPEAFLLVDDSVQDKRYSRFIDVAKRPYPDNAPGMVTGIRLVNLVQGSGEAGGFLPLDYRAYAPDQDGQSKNDHFLAMFDQVVAEGKLLARTIIVDSWYAGSTHLKRIHRAGWAFFTTLKSNRLVSLARLRPAPGGYSPQRKRPRSSVAPGPGQPGKTGRATTSRCCRCRRRSPRPRCRRKWCRRRTNYYRRKRRSRSNYPGPYWHRKNSREPGYPRRGRRAS